MTALVQTVNVMHHHANANCLLIVLQMTVRLRKEKQEVIAPLFEVTDFFTSGDDADIEAADMHENKKEFGILLQRSGLMTKDAIEKQIADMKHKFDEASKVRISLISTAGLTQLCFFFFFLGGVIYLQVMPSFPGLP